MSFAKDFLATWDKNDREILAIPDLPQKLRDKFHVGRKTGVFERYKRETYLQASYKPFIIAAMMLYGQFGNKIWNMFAGIKEKK